MQDYRFNRNEQKIFGEIIAEHKRISEQAAKVNLAIKVAIASLCAAHDLEGDWRISDDECGLTFVEPEKKDDAGPTMQAAEANVEVKLNVIRQGEGGDIS